LGVRVELSIARAPKSSLRRSMSNCIFAFLFRLSTLMYLFYLVLVLSIVISLWVICPTLVELLLLGFVEDREVEVGVSFYKL
jgi:hypothetical protein